MSRAHPSSCRGASSVYEESPNFEGELWKAKVSYVLKPNQPRSESWSKLEAAPLYLPPYSKALTQITTELFAAWVPGRACREISATADTTPRGDPVSMREGLVLAGSTGLDC